MNISSFHQSIQPLIDNHITNVSYSPLAFSLFIQWLPIARTKYSHILFTVIWPVLAAMPFGWSYVSEYKSGVSCQFLIQSSKKQYFIGKYAAVFISGGIVIAAPVAADLLLNALVCPYVLPNAVVPINVISDGWFMSQIYYRFPWLYALLWCGVEFLLGGSTACCCFLAGKKKQVKFMTILTPFILFLLWDAVYSNLASIFSLNVELSPLALFAGATERPNPEWAVLGVIFFLVCTSFGIGYWRVVKHDAI